MSQAPTVNSTTNLSNKSLTALQRDQATKDSPEVKQMLAKVSSGKMSMKDAIEQLNQIPQGPVSNEKRDSIKNQIAYYEQRKRDKPNEANFERVDQIIENLNNELNSTPEQFQYDPSAGLDALATDPITGARLAAQEVMDNPVFAGLFGKEGLSGKAVANYDKYSQDLASDREALMGRDESYGLKDSDLAAYGQASNNIARQYGQSGQSLAHMLADRGLGSSAAPSAQLYSGHLGNQNEQLAGAQLQIAQSRINTAKELAMARTQASLQAQAGAGNLAGGIGTLGLNAVKSQFGHQIAGSENRYNQKAAAAGMGMQQQNMAQQQANANWEQQQASGFDFMKDLIVPLTTGAAGAFTGGAAGTMGKTVGKNIMTPKTKP